MPADFTGNQYWQPGESVDYAPTAKPRQAIKQDLTDSVHQTTHEPPPTSAPKPPISY